jgi:hypothetical protein
MLKCAGRGVPRGTGMEISALERAYVQTQGLHITEKCDGCGKLLNQSFRYTIGGKPEVYCSAGCRDLTFFVNAQDAKKHSTPGKCVYCGATLEGKRRGALYCDEICKKRVARTGRVHSAAQSQITGTPTQLNQGFASQENGRQGDCIARRARPPRNARREVAAKTGLSVEAGQATPGSRCS